MNDKDFRAPAVRAPRCVGVRIVDSDGGTICIHRLPLSVRCYECDVATRNAPADKEKSK